MASALEDFVNTVRSLSMQKKYKMLIDEIKDSLELLCRNWIILDNVLETLDMQEHTIGVIYVLTAKLNSSSQTNLDDREIVTLVKNFVCICDEKQLSYALPAFYKLCHAFANILIDSPVVLLAIPVLAQAIAKAHPDPSHLTSIHTDLCWLSLKAKHFKIALQYLDQDITEIITAHTAVKMAESGARFETDPNEEAKEVLLYYLYGGHIYAAVKNYKRALFFYEICLSIPAIVLSEIMIDAYKRYFLLTLITEDALARPPKHSPNVITRYVKSLVQPYYDLAFAYVNSSADEFRMILYKYREQFETDNNIGCVKEVSNCYFKRNIKRLTKTFSTITFNDIATRAQLSNSAKAEKILRDMIQSGEICATIDQVNGIVVFESDVEKYDSPEMFHQIQENVSSVMGALKQLNKMEEDITLDVQYVKKLVGGEEELINKIFHPEPME